MTIITACSGLRFDTREQRLIFHNQVASLTTAPTDVEATQIKWPSHLDPLEPSPNRIASTWGDYKFNPARDSIAAASEPQQMTLEKAGSPDRSSPENEPTTLDRIQQISDAAGQVLVGILLVSAVAFLIAIPFLL